MTIDDLVTEDVTIVQVVEAYVKHNPQSRRGPVAIKNWFQKYDTTTGKFTGKRPANKHYERWRKSARKTGFEEWIKEQIPKELAKQLEQTPYFLLQETTIETTVKAYIKHKPHAQFGPVPLKRWFAAYDIKKGKPTGKSQANRFYVRWRESARKMEFEDWIKEQIPPELKKQIEQTPYFQQKECSIVDIVKAYIKHKPQSYIGPVPLKNWFAQYYITTAERTKIGQGRKHYRRWAKHHKSIEFEEWALKHVPEQTQNEYFQTIHGIQDGALVLKTLEQAIKKQPIKLDVLRSDSVKRMLTAYYIERDIHPAIEHFSPYTAMLYLNTKPEERQQLRA